METHPILGLIVQLILAGLIGLFLYLVKSQINRIEAKVQNVISKDDCLTCHRKQDEETDEQWAVINHHGHRGLSGDGNQVVRLD